MANTASSSAEPIQWFAIKTHRDFKAEEFLKEYCDEVFFPKEKIATPSRRRRMRAIIPRVLFVKTTSSNILELERQGRADPLNFIPFWIYRYPTDKRIQVIPQSSIDLLRLLTAEDTTRCEIFNKSDFRENQKVRVIGGPFQGYEGYVQRVKKNRHVIVKIEGVCLVMLPYIHPDLLVSIEDTAKQ